MSSCLRRVTQIYCVMFFLFWFNSFFLLSILCVIQRDSFDTHRNDDDSFASSHRNAQCDVFLRNIHMFVCFDTHIFYDRIFDIWSIVEYDSSIRNISLFSTYTRAICHDVSICLSCRRSLISTSSTKNSSYDSLSKFIVYLLFLSSSEMSRSFFSTCWLFFSFIFCLDWICSWRVCHVQWRRLFDASNSSFHKFFSFILRCFSMLYATFYCWFWAWWLL